MSNAGHLSYPSSHRFDSMHRSSYENSQTHPYYVQSSNFNSHHDTQSAACNVPAPLPSHRSTFPDKHYDTHHYERSSRYPSSRQDALRIQRPDYDAHHRLSKDSHDVPTSHGEHPSVKPTSLMPVTCSKAERYEIKSGEKIIPSVSYEKSSLAGNANAIGQSSDMGSTYSSIGSIASNFWKQYKTSPSPPSPPPLSSSSSSSYLFKTLHKKDFTTLSHVLTLSSDDQSYHQPSQTKHTKHDISQSLSSSNTNTVTTHSVSQIQSLSKKRIRRPCGVGGCTNRVVQGGVCIRHGARRKKCNHPGCTKHVKKAGRCSTHGPPRQQCNVDGCTNVSVQGGRCISHGASKKKCCIKNCSKQAILSGMCKKHYDEMIVQPLKEQALRGNIMEGLYSDGKLLVCHHAGEA